MRIAEVTENKKQYLDLLLLADEQEDMVDRYLDKGKMYVLEDDGVKCECIVTDEGNGILEIKNIATVPPFQRKGYAKALIEFLVEKYRRQFSILQVGTGDSPLTIPFYEKCGFVRSHTVPDFFTDHYDHPIYECGVHLVDMVYLHRPLYNKIRFIGQTSGTLVLGANSKSKITRQKRRNPNMIYTSKYTSPLGGILLAADEVGLRGLWFDGQKYFARDLPDERTERETPVLSEAKRWLDLYFGGQEPDFLPPLHPVGTPFRQAVWEILLRISYGKTVTYGEISKQLAEKMGLERMSAQAVGGAVGHNEISIIIPCHRVVGSNGSLTGYAGGINRKIKLLELERADMSRFFVPKKGTAL